jgi:protein-S-isoprenylcysteine O-methyltransferase Ste14
MNGLELKLPPLLLVVILAVSMWLIARASPDLTVPLPARVVVAILLLVCGISVATAGVFAFRKARTTVDPRKPEASSSIVTTGVYRYTRNPMYLGFLLALLAWAAFLSHLVVALLPVLFVIYMNRFQIGPEERALRARFGPTYDSYLQSTRRWV